MYCLHYAHAHDGNVGIRKSVCRQEGDGMYRIGERDGEDRHKMRALSTPPVDGPVRGPSISLKMHAFPGHSRKQRKNQRKAKAPPPAGWGHTARKSAGQQGKTATTRRAGKNAEISHSNSTVRAKRCRMQKCMRSEPNAFCFLLHNQVLSQRRSLRFILCVQDAGRIISRDREVFSLMPETAASPCRKRQLRTATHRAQSLLHCIMPETAAGHGWSLHSQDERDSVCPDRQGWERPRC